MLLRWKHVNNALTSRPIVWTCRNPAGYNITNNLNLNELLSNTVSPWRRFGNRMVYACGTLAPDFIPIPPAGITHVNHISADPILIAHILNKQLNGQHLNVARTLCPDKYSCRNFCISPAQPRFLIGVLFIVTTLFAFPKLWLITLLLTIITANIATTIHRLAGLISWRKDLTLPYWLPNGTVRIPTFRRTLKVTILVPLFNGDAVLPELINTLQRLDYQKAFLEVIFLLEEVDTQTPAALSRPHLPNFINTLTTPEDWLQTKPKAMNYALKFCAGEIIGIYDAEDRPDPDQITKVVDHLLAAPANVACVQGYLDFYNSRTDWISRCFTIEYATWFRVILKGLQTLGLPIPLRGTTVFFRRSILEKIGG